MKVRYELLLYIHFCIFYLVVQQTILLNKSTIVNNRFFKVLYKNSMVACAAIENKKQAPAPCYIYMTGAATIFKVLNKSTIYLR